MKANKVVLSLLALFLSAVLVANLALCSHFKNTFAILALVSLFFTLSTGLMVLPFDFLPRIWGISVLGLDLLALGILVTAWDAFDEGESMRSHLLRSFVSAFYYAGALAALVLIFIALDGGLSYKTDSTNQRDYLWDFGSNLLVTNSLSFGQPDILPLIDFEQPPGNSPHHSR